MKQWQRKRNESSEMTMKICVKSNSNIWRRNKINNNRSSNKKNIENEKWNMNNWYNENESHENNQ